MRILGMLNAVEIPCFASHLYDQLKKKKERNALIDVLIEKKKIGTF